MEEGEAKQTFFSVQGYINNGPNKTVNYERYQKYMLQYIEEGFKKIEWEELRTGQRLKLLLRYDNGFVRYRSGGYLVELNNELEYILIRTHSGSIFSVQRRYIVDLWALNRKSKKKEGITYEYKKPDETLRHKLYIGDVLVYSSNDLTKVKRAENTDKYKESVKTNKFKIV